MDIDINESTIEDLAAENNGDDLSSLGSFVQEDSDTGSTPSPRRRGTDPSCGSPRPPSTHSHSPTLSADTTDIFTPLNLSSLQRVPRDTPIHDLLSTLNLTLPADPIERDTDVEILDSLYECLNRANSLATERDFYAAYKEVRGGYLAARSRWHNDPFVLESPLPAWARYLILAANAVKTSVKDPSTLLTILTPALKLARGPLLESDQAEASRLLAVTLTNTANAHHLLGHHHAALRHLDEAYALEIRDLDNSMCPATTHASLAAVLSALGRYHDGLQHAITAVNLLAKSEEVASAPTPMKVESSLLHLTERPTATVQKPPPSPAPSIGQGHGMAGISDDVIHKLLSDGEQETEDIPHDPGPAESEAETVADGRILGDWATMGSRWDEGPTVLPGVLYNLGYIRAMLGQDTEAMKTMEAVKTLALERNCSTIHTNATKTLKALKARSETDKKPPRLKKTIKPPLPKSARPTSAKSASRPSSARSSRYQASLRSSSQQSLHTTPRRSNPHPDVPRLHLGASPGRPPPHSARSSARLSGRSDRPAQMSSARSSGSRLSYNSQPSPEGSEVPRFGRPRAGIRPGSAHVGGTPTNVITSRPISASSSRRPRRTNDPFSHPLPQSRPGSTMSHYEEPESIHRTRPSSAARRPTVRSPQSKRALSARGA